MNRITLTLYDTLKNVLSMNADVIVLEAYNHHIVTKHDRTHNVEDDLEPEYYNLEVTAVGASLEHPGSVIVYVSDEHVTSSIKEL